MLFDVLQWPGMSSCIGGKIPASASCLSIWKGYLLILLADRTVTASQVLCDLVSKGVWKFCSMRMQSRARMLLLQGDGQVQRVGVVPADQRLQHRQRHLPLPGLPAEVPGGPCRFLNGAARRMGARPAHHVCVRCGPGRALVNLLVVCVHGHTM